MTAPAAGCPVAPDRVRLQQLAAWLGAAGVSAEVVSSGQMMVLLQMLVVRLLLRSLPLLRRLLPCVYCRLHRPLHEAWGWL